MAFDNDLIATFGTRTFLKAVLVFCQKSAKIMLIFFKVLVGLHKNADFFRFFLNIEYFIFQIFSYIFQQQNVTINGFFFH